MSVLASFKESPEIAELFPDLHPAFTRQQAVVESNRCLNCFDAPCTAACPTHIDVPKFIKKIASGNLRGSATSILEANVLAASCSRVCPVEVLCEGSCVMHRYNEQPIEIGRLQRFAMETFYNSGGALQKRNTPQRSEKIACIGAGPASLACAAELCQQGFHVTIFDKRPLPGGLNTYGVAEYKLRTADSLREIELIRNLGVEFVTADITNETALAKLESEYDAIFLGIGLGEIHKLSIPGGTHQAVVDALEYIAAYKTGSLTSTPSRVAVIGAGNTAIDAAVAARRLGATEVHILYRRDRAAISAFDFEYDHAKHEGVAFLWSSLPISVIPQPEGHIVLECIRTEAAEQGSLTSISGSEFQLHCDLVIPAIGQSPLVDFLSKLRGVEVSKGRIVVDRTTGQTTNPKYFAGGDCINGGREVVDAVADGKRAALGITASLTATQEAVHG